MLCWPWAHGDSPDLSCPTPPNMGPILDPHRQLQKHRFLPHFMALPTTQTDLGQRFCQTVQTQLRKHMGLGGGKGRKTKFGSLCWVLEQLGVEVWGAESHGGVYQPPRALGRKGPCGKIAAIPALFVHLWVYATKKHVLSLVWPTSLHLPNPEICQQAPAADNPPGLKGLCFSGGCWMHPRGSARLGMGGTVLQKTFAKGFWGQESPPMRCPRALSTKPSRDIGTVWAEGCSATCIASPVPSPLCEAFMC